MSEEEIIKEYDVRAKNIAWRKVEEIMYADNDFLIVEYVLQSSALRRDDLLGNLI